MDLDSCGKTVVRYTFVFYDNGSARGRHLATTLLMSNQREVLYSLYRYRKESTTYTVSYFMSEAILIIII